MSLPAADGGLEYDALLVFGFGGPEGPDDVVPFLENVTRGRGIPRERLVEVGAHYAYFGGVSPINEQNRALCDALRDVLGRRGLDLPVYWGNRNWHPMLADTLRAMRADGVARALVLVTSAYSSYSGCRQYRENLAAALAELAADADGPPPVLERLRQYYDQPGFIGPTVDAVADAIDDIAARAGRAAADGAHLVFTTHSIPQDSADASGPPGRFLDEGGAYVAQHRVAAAAVADGVEARTGVARPWELVFQSRSGPATQEWLEPDVSDHLETLSEAGAAGAVLVPIGFISDHIEVLWDLDEVAMGDAARLGLPCARAATVGTDPRFVAALCDLVVERTEATSARPSIAPWGAMPDRCAPGCCPNPRGPKPALGDEVVAAP